MKLILNLLTTTLLCLSLTMCKKDPQKEQQSTGCQYDSSVEEMKKWYYFKTGTWWVYQEQTTGELDTITVYYDWAGTNSSGTVGFEWYGSSSYNDFNYKYRFNSSYSIHCLSDEECTCHKIDRSKTMPGNFVGAGKIFLFPLIEGNYTASNGGWCTLDKMHNSYELNSTSYSNVAEWDIPVDGSEGEGHTKYWIGKEIGIIKHLNYSTGRIWYLIDYAIMP